MTTPLRQQQATRTQLIQDAERELLLYQHHLRELEPTDHARVVQRAQAIHDSVVNSPLTTLNQSIGEMALQLFELQFKIHKLRQSTPTYKGLK